MRSLSNQNSYLARHWGAHLAPSKGPHAPKWYIVDGTDQVVGRLATVVAAVINGKHKPTFTRHADVGDYVIVTNADKIVFTRNKWDDKKYYSYSGYIGGLKMKTAREMKERKPEEILKKAVWGMLGKTSLAKRKLGKLKVFKNGDHTHSAQNPQPLPKHVLRRTSIKLKNPETQSESKPASKA